MRINISNNFIQNIPKLNFRGIQSFKGIAQNFAPLGADVFQKSEGVQQTKSVQGVFENSGLERLYDETFETFVQQNPMFKELSIEKPKLVFNHDESASDAGYSFATNAITANDKLLKEDWHIITVKTKDGQVLPLDVVPNSNLQNAMESYKKNSDMPVEVVAQKLTNKEKELWQKGVFAHELRHCLQEHMEASLNGYTDRVVGKYKSKILELINASNELCNLYAEANGKDSVEYKNAYKELEEIKDKYSYILNYKPKKLLDENATLPYTIFPESYPELKNKKWSVKDHFFKSSLTYNNSNKETYYSSPLEIDAYRYQEEFLMRAYKDNPKEYSDNMILSYMMMLSYQYEQGLNDLEKNGYPPLE